MRRLTALISLALLTALLPAVTTRAQGVSVQVTDASWQAQYWNNPTQSGQSVLLRKEQLLNYPGTHGSFAPGVPSDGFSARYEKYIDVPAGSYRFVVTADDGVRLTVDDRLVIDKWFDQAASTYTVDLPLSTGYHYIVLDYYENRGEARFQFDWGPASSNPQPGSWKAEFWNNSQLSGDPTFATTAPSIDFDWGQAAPLPGISPDNFSARFTRTINFPAGTYRFQATADDGIRVYVGGRPVIDQWRVQAARNFNYEIYLPGGETEVRVEYFDAGGHAVAKVRWDVAGAGAPAPGPVQPGEVLVDDTSSGFVRGGAARSWREAVEGHGGQLTWTRNNRERRPNYNWARWYPELSAGQYEVLVHIPDRYTTTSNAVYWISHQGGYSRVSVDQDANGGRWVSLGTYTFRGNASDYVSLNDITGEAYLSRLIAFDAVKFVPR